jgi:carbonic anhydrase/acetyltransferase-like protein (isoleucine patch superfamily)
VSGHGPLLLPYGGRAPRVDPTAFVAPTAVLVGDVEVGAGASVFFGAVLRGDLGPVVVAEGAVVQDNCVLHGGGRGVWVGPGASIGHGAVLNNCRVERGALVGILAAVLDGAVVGEEAVVGAGSVVLEGTEIPPRVLAAGVPARVKKPLSGRAEWWAQHSAEAAPGPPGRRGRRTMKRIQEVGSR